MVVLLAMMSVWMLVITVLLAGVVRHLGALQLTAGTGSAPGFDYDADGPSISAPAPVSVLEQLQDALQQPDEEDITAVLLAAGCESCIATATSLAERESVTSNTVFLLSGREEKGVHEFRRILTPTRGRLLTDPAAKEVAAALNIHSTPFAVRFSAGHVIGKAFIRSAEDYEHLVATEVRDPGASFERAGAPPSTGRRP